VVIVQFGLFPTSNPVHDEVTPFNVFDWAEPTSGVMLVPSCWTFVPLTEYVQPVE